MEGTWNRIIRRFSRKETDEDDGRVEVSDEVYDKTAVGSVEADAPTGWEDEDHDEGKCKPALMCQWVIL